MPEITIRFAVLLLVAAAAWLLVACGRRFVDTRRQRALSATLPTPLSSITDADDAASKTRVHIPAFSTP